MGTLKGHEMTTFTGRMIWLGLPSVFVKNSIEEFDKLPRSKNALRRIS